jgi:hypothetical protein
VGGRAPPSRAAPPHAHGSRSRGAPIRAAPRERRRASAARGSLAALRLGESGAGDPFVDDSMRTGCCEQQGVASPNARILARPPARQAARPRPLAQKVGGGAHLIQGHVEVVAQLLLRQHLHPRPTVAPHCSPAPRRRRPITPLSFPQRDGSHDTQSVALRFGGPVPSPPPGNSAGLRLSVSAGIYGATCKVIQRGHNSCPPNATDRAGNRCRSGLQLMTNPG